MTDVEDHKLWEEILEDLQGTCKPMYRVLEWHNLTEECMTKDFYDYIDSEIFMCDVCGWWYELSQESTSNFGCCIDCKGDEDD